MNYEQALNAIQNAGGFLRVDMMETGSIQHVEAVTEKAYSEWFFQKCDLTRNAFRHPLYALRGFNGVTPIKWSIGGLPLTYLLHSPAAFSDKPLLIGRGNSCNSENGGVDPNYPYTAFQILPPVFKDFNFYYFLGRAKSEDIDAALPNFIDQYGKPVLARFKSLDKTNGVYVDNFTAEWRLHDGTIISLVKRYDLVPDMPWTVFSNTPASELVKGEMLAGQNMLKDYMEAFAELIATFPTSKRGPWNERRKGEYSLRVHDANYGGVDAKRNKGAVFVVSPYIGGHIASHEKKLKKDF